MYSTCFELILGECKQDPEPVLKILNFWIRDRQKWTGSAILFATYTTLDAILHEEFGVKMAICTVYDKIVISSKYWHV